MTAAAKFQEVYGHHADGVWAAPGRVNLIGEHTDYNQGYVLPFALPQRTYVAATAGDGPPQWQVWSDRTGELVGFDVSDLRPGAVTGWAGYVAGVVWALRTAGYEVPGAKLAVTSEVPPGAGLSSSAALECAVLAALADLAGLDLPVAARPALARRAEHDYVGVPCGIMDQTAAIRCQAGYALFLDCRSGDTEAVSLDFAGAGLAMLVIDTRAPHRLVTGEYAARRTTCAQAAATLGVPALRDIALGDLDAALARLPAARSRVGVGGPAEPEGAAGSLARQRVRHVVTENQRVLDTVAMLRAGAVRSIGPLLSASHASLRDDYQVTVPELDLAAATAEAAGARGARMTGAGFGGCVIALVDADAVDTVAATVGNAFAARGFPAPGTFVAAPSQGALRIS